MTDDPNRMLAVAREAAEAAGAIQLEHFETLAPDEIHHKGAIDLVTVADTASERAIVDRLRAAFPDHAIVAEEGGEAAASNTDAPRWYVDPLDGTTNYVHGFPLFGASIACWSATGEPLVGVVHAPYLRETFHAVRGGGAFLGDRRLSVTPVDRLDEAVLATGFAYGRKTLAANNVANFDAMILDVRGIRRGGSAALDLAYVAAGRLDGMWEPWLNAWDVAAGILLVREAGGLVTDFTGGGDPLHGRAIVAAGPRLHPQIRAKLVEGPGLAGDTE